MSNDEAEIDPRQPWTVGELQHANEWALDLILQRDLAIKPPQPRLSADDLKRRVLEEQTRRIYRGTVAWAAKGTDEIALYNPEHARFWGRQVRLAESLRSWAELRKLSRRDEPVADMVMEHLWGYWLDGDLDSLGIDGDPLEEPWSSIESMDDLLKHAPGVASLSVKNRTGDGGYRLVDPLDPAVMGVPFLVIWRFARDRANFVSDWVSFDSDDLVSIRATANAIGWRLRQGNLSALDM